MALLRLRRSLPSLVLVFTCESDLIELIPIARLSITAAPLRSSFKDSLTNTSGTWCLATTVLLLAGNLEAHKYLGDQKAPEDLLDASG